MHPQILKGSQRYEYQFFQFKRKHFKFDKKATKEEQEKAKEGIFKNFTVGMIVDHEGHCNVMEAYEGGRIKVYYTTLRSLGFVDQTSIDQQGISGTVTQIWKDVVIDVRDRESGEIKQTKQKKLIDIKYNIDKCGIIRSPQTTCRACGIDWIIWKDHPQHDCKTAKEITWQGVQKKLAEEVLGKKEK